MVKKRLGELLLEAGVIDDAQLKAALGHQRKWGGKLGQALLDLRLAQEPQIVTALSRKFGYEAVSVSSLPRTPALEAALKLVPRELATRELLLPIAADTSTLTVAMADPSNIAVVDEVSFRAGRRVKIVLSGDREIAAAVRRLYYPDEEPPRRYASAIPLEESAPTAAVEMTRDPFAAMPDYMREGYFHRPVVPEVPPAFSRTPTPGQAPPPVVPRARPPGVPPPALPVAPAMAPAPPFPQPSVPPALAPGVPGVRRWPDPGVPPPPPPVPAALSPPPPRVTVVPEELLGEPVLASDLAPVAAEEIPGEPVLVSDLAPAEKAPAAPSPAPEPAARRQALLDALDRLGRGEDGLLRSEQLVAALARLLLKRGLVTEAELLTELARK